MSRPNPDLMGSCRSRDAVRLRRLRACAETELLRRRARGALASGPTAGSPRMRPC